MASQPIPFLTPEQYLMIEREAEFRSEYIDGGMYAMSGASINHAGIAANVLGQIREQLKGKPCRVFAADLRLHARAEKTFTYPDIVVLCGMPKFHDNRRDVVTDATVIIEVLSRSTRNYDRGDKFRYYRSLESFAEYLLVEQTEMRAEHYVRQPDGAWLFREITNPSAEIALDSIGCRLRLDSLYEKVDFDPDPEPAE